MDECKQFIQKILKIGHGCIDVHIKSFGNVPCNVCRTVQPVDIIKNECSNLVQCKNSVHARYRRPDRDKNHFVTNPSGDEVLFAFKNLLYTYHWCKNKKSPQIEGYIQKIYLSIYNNHLPEISQPMILKGSMLKLPGCPRDSSGGSSPGLADIITREISRSISTMEISGRLYWHFSLTSMVLFILLSFMIFNFTNPLSLNENSAGN